MIKAMIQNGSYHVEMNFPCTETELSEKLKELGMSGDELAPVGTIIMIEPMELSMLVGQEVSLDTLNFLGKRMDGMREEQRHQFLAILSCNELGLERDLKTVINITYNLRRYTLIEDTADLEKVGLTHLNNVLVLSDQIKDLCKEELIEEGQKLLNSGKGIQTKYGSIFVNENHYFSEDYNGRTLPVYYYDGGAFTSVEVRYLDNKELVQLPNDDIAIKKVLARLGADSLKACYLETHFHRDTSDEWRDKIRGFEKSKNLFQLNALLKSNGIDIMRGDFEKLFVEEIYRELENSGYGCFCINGEVTVNLDWDKIIRIRDDGVMYTMSYLDQRSAAKYGKLSRLVKDVYECCVNYENSWEIDGCSEFYHGVLEFNGTILAMSLDKKYGFQFNIFQRQPNGMCVCKESCHDDYDRARISFAVRSGIIDNRVRFNYRELEHLQNCLDFTLRTGKANSDTRDEMKALNEKISKYVQELQPSDSFTMSM